CGAGTAPPALRLGGRHRAHPRRGARAGDRREDAGPPPGRMAPGLQPHSHSAQGGMGRLRTFAARNHRAARRSRAAPAQGHPAGDARAARRCDEIYRRGWGRGRTPGSPGRTENHHGGSVMDATLESKALELVLDVKVKLTVKLGSCQLPMKDIIEMAPGTVIQLDQQARDPVGLYVNDKLIAYG